MQPPQILFIDGRRAAASSVATFATIDPATGREICRVHALSAALLANFYTQGEICTNGARVFVQQPVPYR